jgi:hypothetical protein
MAHFNLSEYETVDERLHKFWDQYPNGRVQTDMVFYDEKRVVFKASLFKDADNEHPAATGYAEEVFGSSPVNKTSFVENCETSAIGRAASNMALSAKGKRPSQTEMSKANRRSDAPAPSAGGMTKAQIKWATEQIGKAYPGEEVHIVASDLLDTEVASLEALTADQGRALIQKIASK